ncbi:MAG: DUF6591 domain-containing protein [Vulcanibacillus sp.]
MKSKLMFVLLICSCSLLIFSGCGTTDKITDKVVEEASESVLENFSDGNIDVETTWPEDKMGILPKPNGTITYVFHDEFNNSFTVEVTDVNKDDFEDYITNVKDAGYSTDMEMTNDGIYRFSGKHSDKSEVMITYTEDTNSGIIIYIVGE